MVISIIIALSITVRWFWMIDKYSVNVLFWDQWGFYSVLFENGSLWDTFSHQHGPHRQGVGFVLARFIAELSSWDTRVESFAIGVLVLIGALLTLGLKKKLSGKIRAID